MTMRERVTVLVVNFTNTPELLGAVKAFKDGGGDQKWETPLKVEKYGVLTNEYKVTIGRREDEFLELRKFFEARGLSPLRGWPDSETWFRKL